MSHYSTTYKESKSKSKAQPRLF